MRQDLDTFLISGAASNAGRDYPNGLKTQRCDVQWRAHPPYAPRIKRIEANLKASQAI